MTMPEPPEGYDSWIEYGIDWGWNCGEHRDFARAELAALKRDSEMLDWIFGKCRVTCGDGFRIKSRDDIDLCRIETEEEVTDAMEEKK